MLSSFQTSDIRAIIKNISLKGGIRQPKFGHKAKVAKQNPLKHKKVMLKLNPAFQKLTKRRMSRKNNSKATLKEGTPAHAEYEAFKKRKAAAKAAAAKA